MKLSIEQLIKYAEEKVANLTKVIDQSAFTNIKDRLIEERQLAQVGLDALRSSLKGDQVPYAWVRISQNGGRNYTSFCPRPRKGNGDAFPLFTAPQKPVVPEGLHPQTAKLVIEFATALAEKLHKAEQKYGYSDTWMRDHWQINCLSAFNHHISKGDPRDVAAYCAFMWYHGWPTVIDAAGGIVKDGE